MTSNGKPVILIVDDAPVNVCILYGLLSGDHCIKVADSGASALELAADDPRPDLILLDVMMPGMDGYEVCRRLKEKEITRDIPVIFITTMAEEDDEARGLDLGAVDYIVKPFRPRLVQARVHNHLMFKRQRDTLADTVRERTKELYATRAATIESLASLVETRDLETGGHIRRTQRYVRILAESLRESRPEKWSLSDETVELLYSSAPLHDIGKVGIPDTILLKPGKFTPEEFELMKKHTLYGYKTLISAEKNLGESGFLRLGAEIALTHHEKWDGSGYPSGLAGEAIPLSGRLMALADVYDALVSKRVYKSPIIHSRTMEIIKADSGRHFDPLVVEAFLRKNEEFRKIAVECADHEEEWRALQS